eukprot:Skav235863  [mRNA]  locus=scaffold1693:325221:326625:- [translate_table: standard]
MVGSLELDEPPDSELDDPEQELAQRLAKWKSRSRRNRDRCSFWGAKMLSETTCICDGGQLNPVGCLLSKYRVDMFSPNAYPYATLWNPKCRCTFYADRSLEKDKGCARPNCKTRMSPHH